MKSRTVPSPIGPWASVPMTMANFGKSPGFHHIQSSQDLDSLSTSTDTAYALMCNFYRINAGRGF